MENQLEKMSILLFIKSPEIKEKLKSKLEKKYNLYFINQDNIEDFIKHMPYAVLFIAELDSSYKIVLDIINYLKQTRFKYMPYFLIMKKNKEDIINKLFTDNLLECFILPIDDNRLEDKILTITRLVNHVHNITINYIYHSQAKMIKHKIKKDLYEDKFKKYEITAKQSKIIKLIGAGLLNKEIADALGIKISSVRIMISRLLKKCNVDNRIELYNLFRY